MRQSGVALAGGQSTLQAWSRGKFPNPANDGILTAEEVAGMDLNGTWLVTLSACETGVGKVQSGEGVLGLRRAFMMAGAQNLLMTLWPVNDEVTPKIMADFYREALKTGDAASSLAKVQRDWLVKLRKEKGLLAAVRDAGPFAMVVMANPNAKNQEPVKQSSAGTRGMKVVAVDEAQKNTSMESQPPKWSEDHIVVSTYPKVN
jgi:CHAT domain-containing protein